VVIAVLVCALAAGTTFLVVRSTSGSSSATAAPPPSVPPLTVTATSPAAGATGVDPGASVTVTLSAPLSTGTPMPSWNPPVAGHWSLASPTQLQFQPAGPFIPGSQQSLVLPTGPAGPVGTKGQHLATAVNVGFTVAPGSTERLQQLLGQLGYLPLSYVPSGPAPAANMEADPQPGAFAWRWAGLPASLTSLWSEGTENVITQGAVMDFEDQNGLATDGEAGPQVWTRLLADAVTGDGDANPYRYVYVSQVEPETATVYQNGAAVYTTPVNTGVPGAETGVGTFPVYERFTVTTMSGTNPDGSHYKDPGIPWVSYFHGGDALHGFVRGSYGFPQSDGCVEMPPANAAVVYPLTPIGTLVTVSPQ
jgi:lipoprotein-anchoring transpeptidase ErfK/SrfK